MSHCDIQQIWTKFACARQYVAIQGQLTFFPVTIIPSVCLEIPNWCRKIEEWARQASLIMRSQQNVLDLFSPQNNFSPVLARCLVLLSNPRFLGMGNHLKIFSKAKDDPEGQEQCRGGCT